MPSSGSFVQLHKLLFLNSHLQPEPELPASIHVSFVHASMSSQFPLHVNPLGLQSFIMTHGSGGVVVGGLEVGAVVEEVGAVVLVIVKGTQFTAEQFLKGVKTPFLVMHDVERIG